MNEDQKIKQQLIKTIQSYRHLLNISVFVKIFTFSLCVGSFVALILQIIAFIIPFYYANLYSILSIFLSVICVLFAFFIKRYSDKKTALFLDGFGFEERIITAYENIKKEIPILMLQRKDALQMLSTKKNQIKIRLFPPVLQTMGILLFMISAMVLSLIPCAPKTQAVNNHNLKKEIEKETKKVEQVIDDLKNLPKEDFSTEDYDKIQEMIDSLESSLADYGQSPDLESLQKAQERTDYKYSQMKGQLSDISQNISALENMQSTVDSIEQAISEMQSQSNENQMASNQNGQGQNGQNQENNGQNNGQNQGNNQNSGNQQGQNQGNQNQGQGDGDGDGDGDGQGQNQGQGQDGGDGDGGSGNGRGTGTLQNERDYVSVPNEIADNGLLHGQLGDDTNSEFFRMPNGLNWRGTHVPMNSVIGSYEQNAYNGINSGRYPESMSEMIKKYFSSFD